MDANAVLQHQLAMNRETFARLQEVGLKPDSLVQLEFAFIAPSKAAADGLAELLRSETDYTVEVVSSGRIRKSWELNGATEGTTIDLQKLDQWVDWMVTAGAKNKCEFDGWGTSV